VLLGVSSAMLLAINLFTPIMYIMKFKLNFASYIHFVYKMVNVLRIELKQRVISRGAFTGSEAA
jgi:hypothetical protein